MVSASSKVRVVCGDFVTLDPVASNLDVATVPRVREQARAFRATPGGQPNGRQGERSNLAHEGIRL
jgi:hypothetical protein